jgi:hypothetical protein
MSVISEIYDKFRKKKVKFDLPNNLYIIGRIVDYYYEPEDEDEEEEEGILVEVEESNKIPKGEYVLLHEEEIITVEAL